MKQAIVLLALSLLILASGWVIRSELASRWPIEIEVGMPHDIAIANLKPLATMDVSRQNPIAHPPREDEQQKLVTHLSRHQILTLPSQRSVVVRYDFEILPPYEPYLPDHRDGWKKGTIVARQGKVSQIAVGPLLQGYRLPHAWEQTPKTYHQKINLGQHRPSAFLVWCVTLIASGILSLQSLRRIVKVGIGHLRSRHTPADDIESPTSS